MIEQQGIGPDLETAILRLWAGGFVFNSKRIRVFGPHP
jgi:hypothetical protein